MAAADEEAGATTEEDADKCRLELSVVKALFKAKLGEDVKVKAETLQLMAEYLRLLAQEALNRSIKCAELEKAEGTEEFVTSLDMEDNEVAVLPSHVLQIVHQLLLDM